MANVLQKASDNKAPAPFERPAGIETKNGVEYAKERNKETDYMYAGSDRDAVYQAALAQKQRESRSALTSVFNSLTNSATRATTNQGTANSNATSQANSRASANNTARVTRSTQNNRR